jgi:exodeoxyribonuclease VII large subunit
MSDKKIFSVTEFMNYLKGVLTDIPFFRNVSIVGEISNFTAHRSGHFYFSIKDDDAILKVVMFRTASQRVLFKPKNGDRVVLRGSLNVYTASGDVQFYANAMSLDGLGDLYLRYEQLKKDLMEKGYFKDSLKKALPKYPKRIAIISGEGSAAYADITRTLRERWPYATITDYFSYVQGELAIDDLSSNIEKADADHHDVIILARGGGSLEDLWAFNDLKVIMAVFTANTPIISGVGHESDITLVDYVSDYRAATPTAAAVIATPHQDQVISNLRDINNGLYLAITKKIKTETVHLNYFNSTKVMVQPESLFDNQYYRLDLLNSRLLSNTKIFSKVIHNIEIMSTTNHEKILKYIDRQTMVLSYRDISNTQNINHILRSKQDIYSDKHHRIMDGINTTLTLKKNDFSAILKSMKHLSPFAILERGYSITSHGSTVIKSVKEVKVGDTISIKLKEGSLEASVLERTFEHE